MTSDAYAKIPEESRDLIESAIRLMRSRGREVFAEDVVLMAYNLGKMDGRMEQIDRADAMVRETIYADTRIRRDAAARHEGRPEHDMTTFGEPLKPGR